MIPPPTVFGCEKHTGPGEFRDISLWHMHTNTNHLHMGSKVKLSSAKLRQSTPLYFLRSGNARGDSLTLFDWAHHPVMTGSNNPSGGRVTHRIEGWHVRNGFHKSCEGKWGRWRNEKAREWEQVSVGGRGEDSVWAADTSLMSALKKRADGPTHASWLAVSQTRSQTIDMHKTCSYTTADPLHACSHTSSMGALSHVQMKLSVFPWD